MDVERGLLSKKKVAEKFGVPANTLPTWLKKADEIKIRSSPAIWNQTEKSPGGPNFRTSRRLY